MPFTHILLALLVVIIWGVNFIFVKIGLESISPLFLCALRFMLASIPAVFFIKPPADVPFRLIVLYGLVMFAMQFSCLFMGMAVGMTPGLASIIMQVQIFFSLLFAIFFLGEKPGFAEIFGSLISFMGILLIGSHIDGSTSFWGFIFVLGAAAAWGSGNLITKKAKTNYMIGLLVWGSFVAFPFMLVLSLLVEGSASMVATYHRITWASSGALLYTVYASTWVGYGVWNWLLKRYSVSTVVPFTLLVPIVGMLSSVIFLGEPLEPWKWLAGLFVISGLAINLLGANIHHFRVKIVSE